MKKNNDEKIENFFDNLTSSIDKFKNDFTKFKDYLINQNAEINEIDQIEDQTNPIEDLTEVKNKKISKKVTKNKKKNNKESKNLKSNKSMKEKGNVDDEEVEIINN